MKKELPIKNNSKLDDEERKTIEAYIDLRKKWLKEIKAAENYMDSIKTWEICTEYLPRLEDDILQGKRKLKETDEFLFGKGFNLEKIKPYIKEKRKVPPLKRHRGGDE